MFIVICLIFVLLDICVCKKKFYFWFLCKENICYCICFNGYRGNVFYMFYNILYVYDIVLEKNEKEVFIIYVVMIFVLLSDLNIIMYILSW